MSYLNIPIKRRRWSEWITTARKTHKETPLKIHVKSKGMEQKVKGWRKMYVNIMIKYFHIVRAQ